MIDKKEYVYKDLQEKIIMQILPYGSKLVEKEIMEDYEIGRSPLKDVFTKLKNECLIQTFPQSGTFVKELSMNEIREVFQMRIPLEILAARLVPSHIMQNQINSMNFILEKTRKDIKKLSINEFKNNTDKIHHIYYDSIGNKRLTKTLHELHNLCSRVWFAQGNEYTGFQATIDQWQNKINLIKNKDIKELQFQVEEHIKNFAKTLELQDF